MRSPPANAVRGSIVLKGNAAMIRPGRAAHLFVARALMNTVWALSRRFAVRWRPTMCIKTTQDGVSRNKNSASVLITMLPGKQHELASGLIVSAVW